MIFRQWRQVLDGTKTQTRRPVKTGDGINSGMEQLWFLDPRSNLGSMVQEKSWWVSTVVLRYLYEPYRIKWQVGRAYAVQPGRGKKAVGRIRITKIRRERLSAIKVEDTGAEGVVAVPDSTTIAMLSSDMYWAYTDATRDIFRELWNTIYKKPCRWEDNPEVWVLEFELAEAR